MPKKKSTQSSETKAFFQIREKAGRELIDRLKADRDDLILVVLDGLDAAISGSAEIGGETHLIYDRFSIHKVLMRRDGMAADEAEEFCEFNIEGAHYGEGGPIFADIIV